MNFYIKQNMHYKGIKQSRVPTLAVTHLDYAFYNTISRSPGVERINRDARKLTRTMLDLEQKKKEREREQANKTVFGWIMDIITEHNAFNDVLENTCKKERTKIV